MKFAELRPGDVMVDLRSLAHEIDYTCVVLKVTETMPGSGRFTIATLDVCDLETSSWGAYGDAGIDATAWRVIRSRGEKQSSTQTL